MSTLLKDTMPDAEKAESMGMIVTSGELLLRVVNDVLDYSKLESGNVETEVKQSSLQETLNAVVHAIETRASSTNVSLQTNYGVSIGEYFYTDSRRLQQILYNLLGSTFCLAVLIAFAICDAVVPHPANLPATTYRCYQVFKGKWNRRAKRRASSEVHVVPG